MAAQIYSFADGKLSPLDARLDRPLRWAAWRPDGAACLFVGNRGSAALLGDGKLEPVDTTTKQNLRGAAYSPDGRETLLVGNRGTVLLSTDGAFRQLPSPTTENLRRVAWHPGAEYALIVGNAGTVLRYQGGTLTPLPGDHAHTLRAISFRPDGAYALVGAYASTWAGYPRPHALYKCDGQYLQALLTSDSEDDFVAVDWHPGGKLALIAGYAYDPSTPRNRRGASAVNKLLTYDGAGFSYQQVEASTSLLGAAWHPSGDYALLCGEGGALMRYAGDQVEQLDSGTDANLVGPFWTPGGSRALFLRGPGERVYTV